MLTKRYTSPFYSRMQEVRHDANHYFIINATFSVTIVV